MSPSISIITSTLNDAENLQITLANIKNLDYSNFEYIVIDGGSTDGTLDLLLQASPYVQHWISEPDRGIYDAWNKGLKIARGDYIAFLGAGDTFLVNGLQTLVDLALAHPKADYICGRVQFTYNNRKYRIIGKPWHWASFRRFMSTAHVGALHSQRLFQKYGFFDSTYRIAGDYELLLRAKDRLKTAFTNSIVSSMRAGGISQQSAEVLYETRRAKRKHNTVIPMTILFDFYLAYLKLLFRQKILERRGYK